MKTKRLIHLESQIEKELNFNLEKITTLEIHQRKDDDDKTIYTELTIITKDINNRFELYRFNFIDNLLYKTYSSNGVNYYIYKIIKKFEIFLQKGNK